jgi:hypothetical protein
MEDDMRNVEHNKKLNSILVLVSFALTIITNILANVLPINNITTGQVANTYNNLFTPVDFTFGIWIVIYILLAIYTMYQFKFNSRRPDNNDRVVRKVNTYFIISNLANAFWIICWHYDLISLSMVFMVIILLMLFSIRVNISQRSSLSKSERTSIQLPFSVYLGWITVATIANIVTLLVHLEWDRFGYDESFVTVVILIITLIIAVITLLSFKDVPYGLVIIWAYAGILFKHMSLDYFGKTYGNIIITLVISIIILVLTCVVVLIIKKPRRRRRG